MARVTVCGKNVGLDQDKTTTGATCLASIETVTNNGISLLRVGDSTTPCPKCKQIGTLVTGAQGIKLNGYFVAIDGSIVECGCSYGSNLLIC